MAQELAGDSKTPSEGLVDENNFYMMLRFYLSFSLSFSHDHVADLSVADLFPCCMMCDDIIALMSNGMFLCVFLCLKMSLF